MRNVLLSDGSDETRQEEPAKKTKVCRKCGERKDLSLFHYDKYNKDGHVGKCKTCRNQYYVDKRDKNREESILKGREYRKTNSAKIKKYNSDPKTLLMRRESIKKNQLNTIGMKEAHSKVYEALKRGKITKPSFCSWCKKDKNNIIAHHEDYSKPFDINWLCSSCHSIRHGKSNKSILMEKKLRRTGTILPKP